MFRAFLPSISFPLTGMFVNYGTWKRRSRCNRAQILIIYSTFLFGLRFQIRGCFSTFHLVRSSLVPKGHFINTICIKQADISFPVDFLIYQEQQWILDGVHRLAKIFQLGSEFVSVRFHLETVIPQIEVLS